MKIKPQVALAVLVAALALPAASSFAEETTEQGIAQYRQMLGDDNPADLWEARGEGLWKAPRGPNKISLEHCDLGLGPGVLKGAYAQLPKYFADTDRVQDLESRLVTCMTGLQGMTVAEAEKNKFGNGESRKSDLEALSAFVVAQSRGIAVHVSLDHPKERQAYEIGKQTFYYRAGPYDFSCASCHGQPGKRIRLQDLPDLTTAKGAQTAYTTWPGYRVSQGELRTMEWRLNDCFRQQRFPDLKYGSDTAIALTMYLARTADGGVMNAPALKR
jgi:sulfur-oxidizing protein SoxA